MKGLVILYSFLLTTFMTVAGFMDTKSYPELISAVIFFPIAFYFGMLILPKKRQAKIVIDPVLDIIPDSLNKVKNKDYDPERRKFLKLIGAAGGSLFLMTIFTKSTEAAFFGSMPGPGTVAVKNLAGVQIDPAEKKPTDGYNITEVDDAGVDVYYGFVNKDGAWFIQKELSTGAYRYTKGTSDFTNVTTGWPNRASLSYGYFNDIF
jgi:hypothetical protein